MCRMAAGALTPEELETLLEDAFVRHDPLAAAELFEPDAVVARNGSRSARGDAIAAFVAALWAAGVPYVAAPRRVVQARDRALVVGDRAISVLQRGTDGCWRYSIALINTEEGGMQS